MTLPPKHAKVLAYVNRIRAETGLKAIDDLVRGNRWYASSGPIARSLTKGTSRTASAGHRYTEVVGRRDHELHELYYGGTPRYVVAWMLRFNEGLYPEYEEKS